MDHRRIRPLIAALLALVLLLDLGACEQNSSPYAVEEAVYHQGKPSAQDEIVTSLSAAVCCFLFMSAIHCSVTDSARSCRTVPDGAGEVEGKT